MSWLRQEHQTLLASIEEQVVKETMQEPLAFFMLRDICVDIAMVEVWQKFRAQITGDPEYIENIDKMIELFKETLKHRLCSRCGKTVIPKVLHPKQWFLDLISQ